MTAIVPMCEDMDVRIRDVSWMMQKNSSCPLTTQSGHSLFITIFLVNGIMKLVKIIIHLEPMAIS